MSDPHSHNDVEGKWFVRGGLPNGVICKRAYFERPYNFNRIIPTDHYETICQCLENDKTFPREWVTKYQLISIADVPGIQAKITAAIPENAAAASTNGAGAAAALLGKFKFITQGEPAGGDGEKGASPMTLTAISALVLIAALAGVIGLVVGRNSGDDDDESRAAREPLLPPA